MDFPTPSPFQQYFTERGYDVLAPAWPGKDRTVAEIREDPSALAGLGGQEIIDHYAGIIEALPEPPILIGHSFGGLAWAPPGSPSTRRRPKA